MPKGYQFSYQVKSGLRGRSGRYLGDNPYMFQTFASAIAEGILRDIRDTLAEDVSDYIRDRIRAGIYTWSQNLYRSAQSREELEVMHRQMAEGVQQAIVNAYDRSRLGKQPSYRYNDNFKYRRFSNKRLKRALASPEMVGYDYKGVFFPNIELLDKEAPQWYRLNFGTQGTVSNTPPNPLRNMMFGAYPTNVNINFNAYGPSEGFFVPQTGSGFWSSIFSNRTNFASKSQFRRITGNRATNRKGALYLHRLPNLGFEARLSKGIVGARFLDKGANYLNRQYGYELSKLLDKWFKEASAAGKVAVGKRKPIEPKFDSQTSVVARRSSTVKTTSVGQMTESEFLAKFPNWFSEEATQARIAKNLPAGFPPYVVPD